MKQITTYLLLFFLSVLSACVDQGASPLFIPVAYDGNNFNTNAATETALNSQLEALVAEIKKGRTTGVTLDLNTISQLYSAGNPSLKDITTAYYQDRLTATDGWLQALVESSGNTYTPGAPSGQGGTFGGYLFDENGLEMEQMIEKGLFGAALYHHAIQLMQGDITAATADRILRIYGAHPEFPNTYTAANTLNPDKFMANYAARRDKNDGFGLYTAMHLQFRKLQAALKAGSEYNADRDEALASIRLNWEKINAATVINYCHSVISTMSATNVSDSDKAKALHAYGECVGFMHGWRTIPQGWKQISDPEIDEILALLEAPYNATPQSYLYLTDPLNSLPRMTQIISKLQAEYGFSNQEVEDFRKNWVVEQGR